MVSNQRQILMIPKLSARKTNNIGVIQLEYTDVISSLMY